MFSKLTVWPVNIWVRFFWFFNSLYWHECIILLLIFTFFQDLRSIAPPEKTKEEILLFFKLYDPVKEEMRYFLLFFLLLFLLPWKLDLHAYELFFYASGSLGGCLWRQQGNQLKYWRSWMKWLASVQMNKLNFLRLIWFILAYHSHTLIFDLGIVTSFPFCK